MKGFLYFVPGRGGMDPDAAKSIGLGYLTGPRLSMPSVGIVGQGPGKQTGVMFQAKPHGTKEFPRLEFKPESQTWKPCDGGKFWIGVHNGQMPEPEDLKRSMTVPGRTLDPVDDKDAVLPWMIPCLSLLPMSFGLGDNGEETETVMPEHAPMRDAADALYQHYFTGENKLDNGQIRRAVAEILTLNYRVTLWELLFMAALNTRTCARVAYYALDFERFEEVSKALDDSQKKSAGADTPDTSDSTPGAAG